MEVSPALKFLLPQSTPLPREQRPRFVMSQNGGREGEEQADKLECKGPLS